MDTTDAWLRYVAILTPGLTQDQIAKAANVSQGTISRWVNGRKLPTEAAKVASFARGFDRNVLEAFVAAGMLSIKEAQRGLDREALTLLGTVGYRVDPLSMGPATVTYAAGQGLDAPDESVSLEERREGTGPPSLPAPGHSGRRR